MQVSTGVPAARKRGGRRHTKGTCWGRVASEPRAWAADPPSSNEALEMDEARAPWPRQAGRSHRLWRCGSRCQATETTGHRPSRASDVHLRDARKQRESSIGQRGPTPQLQRVVEQAPRRRRIAPDARRARLTDERLETARVDCVGLYRQPISRRHRLQYRTGATERAPQTRRRHPESAHRLGRCGARPQRLSHRLGRHGMRGADRQQSQQRTLLARGHANESAVHVRLERPQDRDLQHHRHGQHYARSHPL
jgi:hypothetical protein